MKNQKGFVWLLTLLVILGVLVVGGGAYWWMHQGVIFQAGVPNIETATTTPVVKNTPPSGQSNVATPQLTHIGGSYYKDLQHVYSQVAYGAPQIIPGADPTTFVYLGNPRGYDMGKDTQHVYVFTQVSSADPSTLVILDNGEWMKDSQHVYEGAGLSPLAGADPNTFALVEDGNFVKDAMHVWYGAELIPNANVNTFVVTGDGTAKDANHVYGHSAPDHLGNTRLTIDGVVQ